MKKRGTKQPKLNLYHKEQLVIILVLLCFVLSGFMLPSFRKDIPTEIPPISKNETNDFSSPEGIGNSIEIEDTSISEKLEDDEVFEGTKPEQQKNESSSKPSSNKNEPTFDKSDKSEVNKSEDKSEDKSNDEVVQKPVDDSNNNEDFTKEETEIKPETNPEIEIESETNPEIELEKEWVPPVYEIVHHEAIYEKRKIVICNYCSEEFETVGKFQVHKDAHGG